MGVIAIVELQKCVASGCIFDNIIDKFSHRNKPSLIILLAINKNFEIDFYYIVLPLSLAIDLRIKSNRKLLLDF